MTLMATVLPLRKPALVKTWASAACFNANAEDVVLGLVLSLDADPYGRHDVVLL